MNIIEIENGYAIKIQYELKDLFKSKFPSAKWNREAKHWEVGKRSKKRLEQWIEQVELTQNELIEHKKNIENSELTESELIQMKNELSRINGLISYEKSQIKNIDKMQIEIEQSKHLIEVKREELAELEKVCVERNKKLNSDILEIENKINNIISISECLSAQRIMNSCYKQVGSKAREKYDDAQNTIKKAIDNLKEVGIESKGLNELYYMNFNRPDRDNPSDVCENDFYIIKEISR